MSFIDGGHAYRERLFDDLAIGLSAGLPIRTTLETIEGGSRGFAARALEAIAEGASFTDGLAAALPLSPLERALLEAGERAGQLPTALKRLVSYHEGARKRREALISKLAYPLFVLHAAIVIPAAPVFFQAGPMAAVRQVLGGLAVLYLPVALVAGGMRAARSTPGSALALERLLLAIPVLGRALRKGAAADYADALAMLYRSAVPMRETLRRAAAATRSPVVAEAAARIAQGVTEQDLLLGEAFAREQDALPRLLIEAVRTGETAGHLDETLPRAANALREDSGRDLAVLVAVIPTLLFLLVAAYVAVTVISMYSALYKGL